jgi:hypothetical protein
MGQRTAIFIEPAGSASRLMAGTLGGWARRLLLIGIIGVMSGPLQGKADTQTVEDQIEKPVQEAIEIRTTIQREQEQWRDERQARIALYERLQREAEELGARREQLTHDKRALEDRVAGKQTQLERMDHIAKQISPFLDEVMARLREFYENDIPFLSVERRRRIDNLERMMAEPDAVVSEKMRKVMEALMVEAEYGHTFEVYRDTVDVAGHAILVDIFRFGRIALFFQSLDGRDCGFYNVAEGAWQPLPAEYEPAVRTAMEIGAKRRPVELLRLPIGRIAIP